MRRPGARTLGLVAAVCALVVAAAFGVAHFVRPLLRDARALAEAVRSGEARVEFRKHATQVEGIQAFQFARLRQIETFRESDTRRVLWNTLELPPVIVEITVPVEYVYTLDLGAEWEFSLETSGFGDPVLVVEAPPITFNSPAPDLSQLGFEVVKGSILRDEDAVMNRLRGRLTGLLEARASENIRLVREVGRRKTAEFVRAWILARYPGAEDASVEVIFRDELEAETRGE